METSSACNAEEIARYLQTTELPLRLAFSGQKSYRGVRGQGDVGLHRKGAAQVLEDSIARYLDESIVSLAAWLRSRADGEYTIEIQPRWVSAWDYRHRMHA